MNIYIERLHFNRFLNKLVFLPIFGIYISKILNNINYEIFKEI